MKKKFLKYLYKIPAILILVLVVFMLNEEPTEDFDFGSFDLTGKFQEIIPEAYSVEEANYPSKWSEIYGSDGKTIAKYILTSPFCDDIRGYGGNLKLAIVADDREIINGIAVLSHRETPSWINGLKNIKFFDSWNGKTLSELEAHKVDAASGATFTSNAVREIVKKRTSIFTGATEYVISAGKTELRWMEGKHSAVQYIILLVSIIALFIKNLNKFRIYIQILSIIFFGIISGKFISLYFLETLSVNGITILTSWATVFLLIISVVIPLFLNKHYYCYYICPFGGVQTLLGKLPVRKIKPNAKVLKFMRTLRLMIFISILILVAAAVNINLTLVEPFSLFIFSSAASITIAGSLIIFSASIFMKNPWCVYLCPTGQFFDLLKDGLPLKKSN
ncbi:MAG: 4Fe-4S binding protein [Candidatus Delongbacteria bacterium]|nr:4Fe-4S binding protein [Candidatus Delongbacteria bacterium]